MTAFLASAFQGLDVNVLELVSLLFNLAMLLVMARVKNEILLLKIYSIENFATKKDLNEATGPEFHIRENTAPRRRRTDRRDFET